MASLVTSIRGVSQVVPHGETVPICDLQVLMLSLPAIFSTTLENIPAEVPYLAPCQELVEVWKHRLNAILRAGEKIS
jgi:hypothetical protein